MSKKVVYDYSKWSSLDVFFTSSNGMRPFGVITKIATAPWGQKFKRAFSQEIAEHCGLIIGFHGQYLLAEMTAAGCVANSPEKYRNPAQKIIEIRRWNGFAENGTHRKAEEYLSHAVRKNLPYETSLLLKYSWLTRWLPIKNKPRAMICSEFVFDVLRYAGLDPYPVGWNATPPHPHQLMEYMRTLKGFEQIL